MSVDNANNFLNQMKAVNDRIVAMTANNFLNAILRLMLGRFISSKLKRNKMSLDVYLNRKRYLSYDKGKTYTEDTEQVYWANITHNLGEMADAAGIYQALWRPEEINAKEAKDIIPIVEKGLADLKARPKHFGQFNASNGWGLYEHFVPFVEKYLEACKEYPDAVIKVSR